MKRYMLFGYDQYYPGGGYNDFEGYFETMDDVNGYVEHVKYANDYYEVFDRVICVWFTRVGKDEWVEFGEDEI